MLIKVQLQVCEDGRPCWEIQLQCQKNEQNSWEETSVISHQSLKEWLLAATLFPFTDRF